WRRTPCCPRRQASAAARGSPGSRPGPGRWPVRPAPAAPARPAARRRCRAAASCPASTRRRGRRAPRAPAHRSDQLMNLLPLPWRGFVAGGDAEDRPDVVAAGDADLVDELLREGLLGGDGGVLDDLAQLAGQLREVGGGR